MTNTEAPTWRISDYGLIQQREDVFHAYITLSPASTTTLLGWLHIAFAPAKDVAERIIEGFFTCHATIGGDYTVRAYDDNRTDHTGPVLTETYNSKQDAESRIRLLALGSGRPGHLAWTRLTVQHREQSEEQASGLTPMPAAIASYYADCLRRAVNAHRVVAALSIEGKAPTDEPAASRWRDHVTVTNLFHAKAEGILAGRHGDDGEFEPFWEALEDIETAEKQMDPHGAASAVRAALGRQDPPPALGVATGPTDETVRASYGAAMLAQLAATLGTAHPMGPGFDPNGAIGFALACLLQYADFCAARGHQVYPLHELAELAADVALGRTQEEGEPHDGCIEPHRVADGYADCDGRPL